MRVVKILMAAAFLFLLADSAGAAQVNCFQCHARDGFTGSQVHEPVAAGQCQTCHNPHVSKHKGLLKEEAAKLCYGCHSELLTLAEEAAVAHQPFADADCLACHAPHSSDRKGLIRTVDSGLVCFECHGELQNKNKFEHRPFADGNCQACHRPHAAERIQLLDDEADHLCVGCHGGDLGAAHGKFPYKVKKEGCLTCHNPHGSDRPDLVRNVLHPPYRDGCMDCHAGGGIPTVGKCLECHDGIGEKLNSIHSHQTNKTGNGCVNCHSPHASDFENLMKDSQKQVCRECHADTWDAYIDKPFKHPDSVMCSNCHGVHGSNNLALLKDDGNATCNVCHETQGVFTHPVGAGVIDPRNGQIMTCVTCHYPHGTVHKANLKLSGSMELCIQCHKNY